VDELEKSVARKQGTMSHEEILQQFKLVFGREMTASERKIFFLPHEDASSDTKRLTDG
jgi:hypothetical protein